MTSAVKLKRIVFGLGCVVLTFRMCAPLKGVRAAALEAAIVVLFGTMICSQQQPILLLRWRSWSFLPVIAALLTLTAFAGVHFFAGISSVFLALEQVWIAALIGGVRLIFLPALSWDERLFRWFLLVEAGIALTLITLYAPPALAPLTMGAVALIQGSVVSYACRWALMPRMRAVASFALAAFALGIALQAAGVLLSKDHLFASIGWAAAWLAFSCEAFVRNKKPLWFGPGLDNAQPVMLRKKPS